MISFTFEIESESNWMTLDDYKEILAGKRNSLTSNLNAIITTIWAYNGDDKKPSNFMAKRKSKTLEENYELFRANYHEIHESSSIIRLTADQSITFDKENKIMEENVRNAVNKLKELFAETTPEANFSVTNQNNAEVLESSTKSVIKSTVYNTTKEDKLLNVTKIQEKIEKSNNFVALHPRFDEKNQIARVGERGKLSFSGYVAQNENKLDHLITDHVNKTVTNFTIYCVHTLFWVWFVKRRKREPGKRNFIDFLLTN